MVSRRKRARLRYLRKWYDRYTHITIRHEDTADGILPRFNSEDPVLLEAECDELQYCLIEARILEIQATVRVQSRFCSACQHTLGNWPALEFPIIDYPRIVRKYDTFSMEAAARSGCQFCACVLQSLLDSQVLELYRKIEVRLEKLQTRSVSSLTIGGWGHQLISTLKMTLPGLKYPRRDVRDICVDIKGCAPLSGFDSAFTSPKNDTLEIACAWLAQCDAGHETCKIHHKGGLPTRLISVSGKSVRLELTETWNSAPHYATLSYCWGGLEFLKTTTSNLERFFAEIPFDELPQTFKDVIRIARAFKIDYVWIDALCIVQDSDADWRKESSRMSEVYGRSYVNIAASSANSPLQGCFTKPKFMCDAFEADIVISGQVKRCKFHNLWYSYSSAVDGSHLLTRAWAIQEKLLPSRTIHFGDRGAFWECRTGVELECLPNLNDGAVRGNHLARLIHDLADAIEPDLSEKWKDVVAAYSKAELTVTRDKLPGIAGIARLFGRYKQCDYLAGMWRDSKFDVQLCWCIFGRRSRPNWRAPTWSWASVDGYASFTPFKPARRKAWKIACMRTLQASVIRVGQDEYGEVTGGRLRLTCSYILSGKFEMIAGRPVLVPSVQQASYSPLPVHLDCTDDIDARAGKIVHIVPVFATSISPVQTVLPAEHEDVRGLVLQKLEEDPGEFRRVGFFTCSTKIYETDSIRQGVEGKTVWNEFINLLHQQGAATARELCAEVIDDREHGTKGFVITIV